MEKNNKSVVKTIVLLIAIVAPSFYLFSSYHSPKMPANNPFRRQKARRQRTPVIKSVAVEPVMQAEDEKVIYEEPVSRSLPVVRASEDNKMPEQLQPEGPTNTSVLQDVQVVPPSPGILMSMYGTIAPIILVTMNKALGGGIEASTKTVIERYIGRRQFMSLKDNIMTKMNAMLKPEFVGISNEQKNKLKSLSDEEKLEIGKQNFLSSKELKTFNTLEQQSVTSSIFSQAFYMGMLNTIVPFISTFIGFGATMGLQTLMPASNSQ